MQTTSSLRWPVLFPLLGLLLPAAAGAQAPVTTDPGQPATTSPAPTPAATGALPPDGRGGRRCPRRLTAAHRGHSAESHRHRGRTRQSELGGFVAAQVTFDSNDAVRQNHLISVDGQGQTGRFGWPLMPPA